MSAHPPILVVDDSSVMRTMIGRGLAGAGVPSDALRFAANGKIALDLIRNDPPALLVTDVQMPEMTGIELVQALSDEGYLSRFPVVVVTSVSSSRDLLSLVRLGAAAVIRKPVDMQSLSNELAPFVAALTAPVPEPEPAPEPETVAADPDPNATFEPSFIDLDHVLQRRIGSMLDRFGFETMPTHDSIGETRVLYCSTLPVARPFVGELRVWAHYETANRMSVALCGSEPGRDDCARLDAVAEILNIVAGDFLLEVTSALGDALNESAFGLPSTFVVGPRTPLPPHARVIDVGGGDLIAVHVALNEQVVS